MQSRVPASFHDGGGLPKVQRNFLNARMGSAVERRPQEPPMQAGQRSRTSFMGLPTESTQAETVSVATPVRQFSARAGHFFNSKASAQMTQHADCGLASVPLSLTGVSGNQFMVDDDDSVVQQWVPFQDGTPTESQEGSSFRALGNQSTSSQLPARPSFVPDKVASRDRMPSPLSKVPDVQQHNHNNKLQGKLDVWSSSRVQPSRVKEEDEEEYRTMTPPRDATRGKLDVRPALPMGRPVARVQSLMARVEDDEYRCATSPPRGQGHSARLAQTGRVSPPRGSAGYSSMLAPQLGAPWQSKPGLSVGSSDGLETLRPAPRDTGRCAGQSGGYAEAPNTSSFGNGRSLASKAAVATSRALTSEASGGIPRHASRSIGPSSRLQAKEHDLEARVRELEATNAELERKLDEDAAQFVEYLLSLETEVESMRAENSRLQEEQTQAEEQMRLHGSESGLRERNLKLENEQKDILQQMELFELEKEEELRSKDEELSLLQRKFVEQASELKRRYAETEREKESLIDTMTEETEELQTRIDKLNRDKESLSLELAKALAQVDVAASEAKRATAQGSVFSTDKNLADVANQLRIVKSERESLKDEVTKLDGQNVLLRSELSTIRHKLEISDMENQMRMQENVALSNQHADLMHEFDTLRPVAKQPLRLN
mmetsp:Transcript_49790/g.132046  ORF Transcript_49790/g.132046 Transcript_49790/m.132046 type:complete len:661 (-) Transcript_49790:677-2659(-)